MFLTLIYNLLVVVSVYMYPRSGDLLDFIIRLTTVRMIWCYTLNDGNMKMIRIFVLTEDAI